MPTQQHWSNGSKMSFYLVLPFVWLTWMRHFGKYGTISILYWFNTESNIQSRNNGTIVYFTGGVATLFSPAFTVSAQKLLLNTPDAIREQRWRLLIHHDSNSPTRRTQPKVPLLIVPSISSLQRRLSQRRDSRHGGTFKGGRVPDRSSQSGFIWHVDPSEWWSGGQRWADSDADLLELSRPRQPRHRSVYEVPRPHKSTEPFLLLCLSTIF